MAVPKAEKVDPFILDKYIADGDDEGEIKM